ncbi:NAD-P-binding protein [Lactarius deliciosus]|nr:NAD-P-binding protein [Lactarius deliciosus]
MTHLDQELPVTRRSDVYLTIDPNGAFANQTYRGKVVFITGASRGIGQKTAIAYAKAGASVTVVGRSQESLDKTAAAIRAVVSEADALEAAVQATLERFGRLDVLIANAGALSNLGDKDPERWWNTFEVNIRGVYNTVRYVLTIMSPSKKAGVPCAAAFPTCKRLCYFRVNRFVEFIALEYPKLTVFALHPGSVKTQMAKEPEDGYPDGMVFDALTSGRLDWLNGKYLSANWDISEIERDWKEKVQVGNALVSKLAIPK